MDCHHSLQYFFIQQAAVFECWLLWDCVGFSLFLYPLYASVSLDSSNRKSALNIWPRTLWPIDSDLQLWVHFTQHCIIRPNAADHTHILRDKMNSDGGLFHCPSSKIKKHDTVFEEEIWRPNIISCSSTPKTTAEWPQWRYTVYMSITLLFSEIVKYNPVVKRNVATFRRHFGHLLYFLQLFIYIYIYSNNNCQYAKTLSQNSKCIHFKALKLC